MVMLKIWRPFIEIVSRKSIISGQLTKSRYLAVNAGQAATASNNNFVEEYFAKHEITINGNGTESFRPFFSFEEANFPDSITQALKQKFDAPSVIQAVSWPPVLSGRDLVGIARTGSGKTLSFMLPALVHISKQEPIRRGDGPIVLVLCPTRELAQQVQTVANEWSNILTRVRTTCVFGGANRLPQETKLLSGVEVVVATPGRLNDFLRTRVTNMRRCSYLVLDEADRMLDMGFEPQIREIINRIPRDRQTLMYSATWPNEIRTLASDFMKDMVHVKIGSAELSANKNITQLVHVTTQMERDRKFWDLLKQLLERDPDGKILVFCLQKILASQLERTAARKGLAASSIHGDKTQLMRDRTLRDFRSGTTQILFATDVAARGLDVDDIKYVVNYDHPFCAEDYVHRIGRTARRDLKGESHTFLTEEDAGERARDLIKVLEASAQPVSDALKKLALVRSSSSKNRNIRRWGSTSGGFSRPAHNMESDSSYFSGRDRRSSSFSDRRHNRPVRSRYDDLDKEDDDTGASRRDYGSPSRYNNFDDGRQERSFSRRRAMDYEEDDDDFEMGNSRRRGGPSRQ